MRCKILLPALVFSLFFLIGCVPSKYSQTPSVQLKKEPLKAEESSFISRLLSQYPQYFDSLLKNNSQYHIKIIYTQINRTADNKPRFTNYYFNVDDRPYFYPASTVKMPTAFLALQKLNELKIHGLNKRSTMITEAAYPGQTSVYNDPSSKDGRPTIENYIKKIFLVSDNDAFNRLYEFLGQEYINNRLHKMGYDSAQIVHHLDVSMTEDENRYSNPVKFYDTTAKIIYEKPLIKSNLVYQSRNTFVGKGFYRSGQIVYQPFDFSRKNRMTLVDLHSVLMSVLFPKSIDRHQRFKLKKDDYSFLYRYLSMKPAESKFPQYDSTYTDAYSKLLLYGGKGRMDDGVRIFNKEGDAYGFLTDVAYIVDFKNGVEFLLSATIYCNSDEIFNDDHYDYETVGYPFMKNLGKVFYEYELHRQRKRLPHLAKFEMSYTE